MIGAGGQLRFRRHLALLGLLWLLHELTERPYARHHIHPANLVSCSPVQQEQQEYFKWLPLIYLNYTLLPTNQHRPAATRFPSSQLDEQVAHYYEGRAGSRSMSQLQLLAIKAALRTAPMLVHSSWGYATQRDKQVSGGPKVNQAACLEQLKHIEARLELQTSLPPEAEAEAEAETEAEGNQRQQDLPLATLLDTYARVPSQLLRGNTNWPGSYMACLDTQLQTGAANLSLGETTTQAAGRIKFRYCLAALASHNWAHSAYSAHSQPTGPPITATKWINFGVGTHHFNRQLFFYRLGVCLPEACDSQVFSDQPQARASISKLAKQALAQPFAGPSYQLTDLYCLPDEKSPLRQLSLSGNLFLGLLLIWILLILLVSSSASFHWSCPSLLYHCFAFENNWNRYTRHLTGCPEASSKPLLLLNNNNNTTTARAEFAQTGNRKQAQNNSQVVANRFGASQFTTSGEEPKVDTRCLNALKVLCLGWLMAAHCVIYLGSAVANPALLKLYVRSLLAYALSVGAIYITELFFIITGCLTSYLIFKHHHTSNKPAALQTTKPLLSQYILLALNRYLRIAPLYLLIYAYVRLVSLKWGGSGPHWDYAVSDNSQRRQCLQESWLPTLTLTTNYLNLYEHCILGGWYLSIDMQFTLLAIPLLLILQWAHQKHTSTSSNRNRLMLAYSILVLTILASASASVISLILRAEVDLSYLLKFVPHSVAMLTSSLNQYTNPILRFRAYAMGLFTGHLLYLYECQALPVQFSKFNSHKWSLTMGALVGCFGTMFAPIMYPSDLIVASHDVTSLLLVLSATFIDLCLCVLILLLCTGMAPQPILNLLRAPVWSLMSSLSLASLLIHTEIIIILTSQLDPPPNVGYSLVLFVFSATVLLTYPIALFVHLCFELPINRLITRLMQTILHPSEQPLDKQ